MMPKRALTKPQKIGIGISGGMAGLSGGVLGSLYSIGRVASAWTYGNTEGLPSAEAARAGLAGLWWLFATLGSAAGGLAAFVFSIAYVIMTLDPDEQSDD